MRKFHVDLVTKKEQWQSDFNHTFELCENEHPAK
jgi:hypothetical protein